MGCYAAATLSAFVCGDGEGLTTTTAQKAVVNGVG
jgi:hypothetical protein